MHQPSSAIPHQPATFASTLRTLVRDHLASVRSGLSSAPLSSSIWQGLADDFHSTLATLQELAVETQTKINHHATIMSFLPTEVLLKIFELVVHAQRPRPPVDLMCRDFFQSTYKAGEMLIHGDANEPEFLGAKGGSLGWLALGHVCSLWRQTLLSQSHFWAGEIGALPLGVSEMLKRAGDARLTLHSYASAYRKGSEAVASLIRHNDELVRRVREVNFVGTSHGHLITSWLCEYDFPALETLRVYAYEDGQYRPRTVRAPALRKARLTNVVIDLKSRALCDLRIDLMKLHPRYIEVGVRDHVIAGIQNQQEFLRAFDPTTLTHLDISDMLWNDSHLPGRSWDSKISLPNMRHMKITSTSAKDTVPLLDGVVIPETALISLNVDFSGHHEEDAFRDGLSALLAAVRIRRIEFTGIAIFDTDECGDHVDSLTHRLEMELYTTPSVTSSPTNATSGLFTGHTHRISLHFDYRGRETQWSLNTILDVLATSTSLDNIHTLAYHGCCPSCAPTVDSSLLKSRFPYVRSLQLADAHSHCSRIMDSLCDAELVLTELHCLWLTRRSPDYTSLSRSRLAEQLAQRYKGYRNASSDTHAYTPRLAKLVIEDGLDVDEMEDAEGGSQSPFQGVVDTIEWLRCA